MTSHEPVLDELDDLDRAIIARLQADGRAPYETIAAAIDVSTEEVERRATQLIEAGVFKVVAVTDPMQVGFPRQALLGLEVDGPLDPVARAVGSLTEVIYLVRVSTRIDLLAEVVGSSDARLLELVAQIRRVPGVRRIHTALLSEVVKETYGFGIA
jgi:Lrp/AsnC family transcriptional regulator for asnA, asnC and gidA